MPTTARSPTRRAVFLHFVDDELVLRLPGGVRGASPALAQLITLVAFASPEPPLFPLSARHELPELGQLLDGLSPLMDAGYVEITGAGATPAAYLDARRRQYDLTGERNELLFGASEDAAIQRYGARWVAKPGSSTAAIESAWEQNMLNGAGGLVDLLSASERPRSERALQRLVELPEATRGRPLIPQVVLREMAAQRLIAEETVSPGAHDSVTAFLCSEWGRVYADALGAFVLGDLGWSLPTMNAFQPPISRLLSGRRLESVLARLGLADLLAQIARAGAPKAWRHVETVRLIIAEDLWRRATAIDAPLWDAATLAALKRFDRMSGVRSFSVRFRPVAREVRLELELERRCLAYAALCEAIKPSPILSMVDKSINIGSIIGNPQIGSGEFASFSQVNAEDRDRAVALALLAALRDDDAAARFVSWVEGASPSDEIDSQALATALQPEIELIAADPSTKRRATRIAGDLSARAAGSLIAAGVLAALKAIGL